MLLHNYLSSPDSLEASRGSLHTAWNLFTNPVNYHPLIRTVSLGSCQKMLVTATTKGKGYS